MKPEHKILAALLVAALAAMAVGATGLRAGVPGEGEGKMKVKLAIPPKAIAFGLEDVRLLDGPFKRAQDLDRAYLKSLEPDRLLHNFRVAAGLPSQAKPLGGWEEPKGELRGHFVGHYLTACSLMYAATGDEALRDCARAIVTGLAECQKKIGSGYLSAFPEEFIDRVEARQRVWAPWYTLHKIYAGLVDAYVHCGDKQALEVVRGMADWAIARTDRLSDEQMERMLGTEHGGMNDTLAELYAVTGEEKYLKLSRRFNHKAVLDPLTRREDRLTGLHANTQFPKVIGAARQYELAGGEDLRTAATFFWEMVTRERSYVIGGNSDGEGFSRKEELSKALGPNTTETCNTYNMLKLTRQLFAWQPLAEYADFYERALLNHILASQNPETGMTCYYVPLRTGSAKTFGGTHDAFWCCTGTGIENPARYGEAIYFHDGGDGLFVNLFIASELAWRDKGVTVRQETAYPESAATRLALKCEKPVDLALHVRHPWWAVSGLRVSINGAAQNVQSTPGSYATLSRTWKDGDTVEVGMPMGLRTEGFRDNPRRFAFMYGPLVLCAQVDRGKEFPVILGEPADLAAAVRPMPGKDLEFVLPGSVIRILGQESVADMTLRPFYKEYKNPYIVYWDALTSDQWAARLEQFKADEARRKTLEARAVDSVQIGVADSEKAHGLEGEKTGAGEFGGKRWRHATDGGWFSYRLKVIPDASLELLCTWWGSDGGARAFDILIDGTKIATEKLDNNRPGKFYDQAYPVPPELTQGKQAVIVRFQAHPGNLAGSVFGCALLRKE